MATAKRYYSCPKTVTNKTNHPELQKNDKTRKLSHAPSRRNSSCQLPERSPESAAWNCSLQYSTVDLHATFQLDDQPSRMAQKVSPLSDITEPLFWGSSAARSPLHQPAEQAACPFGFGRSSLCILRANA
jgi:hypothetical protein